MRRLRGPLAPGKGRPDGLTLVELLVALAITAVAMIAALRLLQVTVDSLAESRLRADALRCADSLVIQTRVDPQAAQSGQREVVCTQGGQAFQALVEVQGTPHLNFRRLEVKVYSQADASRQRLLAERLAFLSVGF